ncbi:hypothetical protein PAECIP111893_04221 [Paenibacillus plantiphilus]|uniref:Uncharacterized protein n=1 Tax=Paenibacillus plantiphilus TaxID=2905650 RepID=A0ABN8GXP7_9BACL|nr:hypothetical protein [Paenibacillus plantiphilus]CAH1216985.1 hypothetical protein PAECIP111893_04221 [Paenibacillus plantiphilus]
MRIHIAGNIIIYKMIISILVVVALSELSKKVNPTLGGILAGLPLGTGLSVYFISYEKGTAFLISGIPWAIASLSASIIFCFVYLSVARKMSAGPKVVAMLAASAAGSVMFVAVGYMLYNMPLHIISAVIVFIVVFVVNIKLIRTLMTEPAVKSESKNSLAKLLIRAVFAGAIILLITGLGVILGSKWSGILSSFPSTLFPLIVILHVEDGNKVFPSVIHGFSYSVSTLVVFYLVFMILAPIAGLNLGFLVTYAVCGVYLVLFFNFKSFINRFRKSGDPAWQER